MSDRFREAFSKAVKRIEDRQWIYGILGRKNSDGTFTFDVPGRRGFLYVTIRNASGAQTVVVARNDFGVEHRPNLGVRMRLEHGIYVIWGRANRSDLVHTPDSPDYGIPDHPLGSHSDTTFTLPYTDGDIITWDGDEGAFILAPVGSVSMGGFGGDSVEYVWVDLTGDADPGISTMRFNHADFASVTQIYVDDENLGADDIQPWLATLGASTNTVKGHIRIWKRSNNLVFRTFAVTGVTEATGYWKIDVTPIVSAGASGTLDNGDIVILSFARAGDVGATGAQGDPGDAADIATEISAATTDDAITDADLWGYVKAGVLVKTTWANIKAVLTTAFVALTGNQTVAGNKHFTGQVSVANAAFPPVRSERTVSGVTNTVRTAFSIKSTTDADMADGFGTGFAFELNDNGLSGQNLIAEILGVRDGGDTSGALVGRTYSGGVVGEVFRAKPNGNFGIGVANPQGPLHVYDGVGGFLAVTKTGITGTAQTIIPDGAGDCLYRLKAIYITRGSNGVLWSGDVTVDNGGSDGSLANDGGFISLALRVNANGSIDVRRVAGALTYTTSLWMQWI